METENSVVDKKKLTDEEIGKIYRKTNEIIRRINEGTIPFEDSVEAMQKIIIEGHSLSCLNFFNEKVEVKKDSTPIFGWQGFDKLIYFAVVSDGTTGPDWIKRLQKKGFSVGRQAETLLWSSDFKPTSGKLTIMAIVKGNWLSDDKRVTENIYKEANRLSLCGPNMEVACLIREKFSDQDIKAMGLNFLVTMHSPVADSHGDLKLLDSHCRAKGNWFGARYGKRNGKWPRGTGFVFSIG